MTDSFDIVIIGASFAGLVCARAAAERGLRVAVVEKKREPGAAVRTTGILVKEAAEACPLPARLTRKVRGVRLYAPSLASIDLDRPGYYFLATDTPAVLRELAARAQAAGARIYYGTAFTGARREGDIIELAKPALRARFLVGADGPRSTVAEFFGLGRNRRYLIGIEAEYEGVRGVDGDRLHCFLDSRLAPGYIAWLVPGLGVTQVGLACRRAERPDLKELVRKISPRFDFSKARVVARRSGPIPVGGRVRPLWEENVLLIGDAAGLVSPLTAGGIFNAVHFGRRAADAIADHLEAGGPHPGPLLARAYPSYVWKRLLRRALDLGPPNWLYNAVLNTGPLRKAARLVYFHTEGLGSRAAWRDVMGRSR